MKNTARITLGSALYTVLLSSSTMLAAADGGGETPGEAATPQRPDLIMRLDDEQLDVVKAGQLKLPDVGGDAPLFTVGNVGTVDAGDLELPPLLQLLR
jgi:hypothetical protein